MKKLNFLKKKNKLKRPWVQYYREGVPAELNYEDISMVELVEQTAKKYPTYNAYEYYGKNVTYAALINKIKEVAMSLKEMGVNENERVTICMPNTPEGIISFYAVNMVGAIANMIHPLSSEKEIENFLNISESKYLITIDVAIDKINKIISNTKIERVVVCSAAESLDLFKSGLYWLKSGRKVKIPKNNIYISWKDFLFFGSDYEGEYRVKKHSKDLALILYSGGTTGSQKGIMLSNLNFNALAMQCHLMCDPSKAGDSLLSILPLFHGFGLGVCIHTPLSIGMKCVLIPSFNYKKFPNLIKKHKPNFIVAVPSLFENLIKCDSFGKEGLSYLDCVISGGDTLTSTLKKKVDTFLAAHGSFAKVRQGYGLTEGSGASCLLPTDFYKENAIGVPFPDTYYKIVKVGTHDEAPYGEDGEICIHGPCVMMGYLNNEEETIQALRKHEDGNIWLHTGDIGYMDETGVVYFRQRLKRIIISSGYNVYPAYIENIINSHPYVLTSTVIGISHPHKVQVAKAFIVLKDNIKLTEEVRRSIKKHCEKCIAKYSLPYEYEFRESLPKTLVGKVAYTKLMEEEEQKIKNNK
jgi:long-chain acyl-CoA synthetase